MRSPYPLAVHWTWVAPASTAAMRVGDGAGGVVLAVDAEARAGAGEHVGDDRGDAAREAAAVGVAQHVDRRARLGGGHDERDAVVGVVAVAVEEVLVVDEDAPTLADQVGDGVAHHREVLLVRRAQGLGHVPHVGLRHDRDDRSLGVEQRRHLSVVLHLHPRLAGGAEGHELGELQVELGAGTGEELGVLGHRTGPAALDELHPEARRAAAPPPACPATEYEMPSRWAPSRSVVS